MSNLNAFLNCLEKLRQTGKNRWIACCPAHRDKSPSLAIKDDDGNILIHCFAGCEPDDIMQAVGMSLSDLFPDCKDSSAQSRPIPACDILQCLSAEALYLLIVAKDLKKGDVLDDREIDRLTLSYQRIQKGIEYGGIG